MNRLTLSYAKPVFERLSGGNWHNFLTHEALTGNVSAPGFNEHWREDADKVGAGDLNSHGNRGTAATLLAEAGATAPEIAEATCWNGG